MMGMLALVFRIRYLYVIFCLSPPVGGGIPLV